ncbi:ROK family protein [Acholeplasma hippikon]|uniref:Transcriptional regulator n=1 Tax=Acholeplasma hippikon TaxID=264636 RepID=A0A449BK22_9MOLU|nr:ROK family protein [Acholeplasma hippikon]VEU82798.1 Uncharacterised protein [Acholeplasma hippikon]
MNIPVRPLKLDPKYAPAVLFFREFKANALKEGYDNLSVVVERNDGNSECFDTIIFKDEKHFDENLFYVERLVKSLLWIYGGYKVTIVGNKKIYEALKEIYANKERTFDAKFMTRVYEQPFEVLHATAKPEIKQNYQSIGKNLDGYRIGFDAGGSDMKVSAVVNGEPIFSEEIVWFPKLNSDPEYHKKYIREAIMLAKSKMPRLDAIGVSSAGVYVNNQAKVASLFIQVPDEAFDKHIKNIYIDIANELNVPIEVANDGDVTALAGAMSLEKNNLLGIAMGTSEAAGYINHEGNITGWINELAFVPVDFQANGPVDEWSGDFGCGLKYFSQDAVIRLAETCGITFPHDMPLAERLKVVQKLGPESEVYQDIFQTIGTYLGYTLAYYSEFYEIENVLLLGRVTSGEGGNIIVDYAKKTLKENFADLGEKIEISLPDEKARRVGQSVAAASLVKL